VGRYERYKKKHRKSIAENATMVETTIMISTRTRDKGDNGRDDVSGKGEEKSTKQTSPISRFLVFLCK